MIDSKLKIDSNGTKYWLNSKGELHRENGPAVICVNGNMYWYINGLAHRMMDLQMFLLMDVNLGI